MVPSPNDIACFLNLMNENALLQYELIASTCGGVVGGFYVMEDVSRSLDYLERAQIVQLHYKTRSDARQEEMRSQPVRFLDLKVGHTIFTKSEIEEITLELLDLAGLGHYAIALPGYSFLDWEFKSQD